MSSPNATPRPAIVALEDSQWADFVASNSESVAFHHPRWGGVVRDCYGFRSFAAVVRSGDGAVRAGLPVIEVRDLMRRRRWVSLPFTDHCPLLAESLTARNDLLELLRVRATAEHVASVEVRTALELPEQQTIVGVVHELALDRDYDSLYRGFRKTIQRDVRRAEREGVVVRAADSERDVAQTYYDLHVRTRRRLGVPAQPRRLFRLLWEQMIEPGHGFVLFAHVGTSAVAGAVFLHWNGHLIYKFGASDAAYWGRRPNHAIFAEAIRWASDRGCRVVDFGRSGLDDEGLRNFKSGWGASERPLAYTALVGARRRAGGGPAGEALAGLLRRSPPWLCRGVGAALYRYAA